MEKKSRNWGRVLGISIPAVIVVALMVCALLPEANVEKIEKISSIISTGLLHLFALMIVLTIIWVTILFTTKWGRKCLSEMLTKQTEERQHERKK